ncbi:MAG: tRNA (adenosine(37)-N6)-threonylcarbamoyltransferase complex dimerization subunit type 1 TsaB [Bacteroidales bacterium OttesenSCG-928-I14]|jgi:tRNA threonylcarbamoyladenosine biosynthesis protein TsaB|nr:tRNA (adenosine(37)-N6)-threonylcarbamoyltransferase complex dimerization subunit type 1 TsaB [Bacteroidales bacterium OttesenSCG-928-I14]
MARLLVLETSTQTCSLSLSINGKVVIEKTCTKENSHASLLGVFILEAIKYANKNSIKIDAVAVSAGPGSYTGLRIGVSEAKGLCYGFNIPLIAIPTLKSITLQAIHNMLHSKLTNPIYCPMIDAKRMGVFTALYDGTLNEICSPKSKTINSNSYKKYLKKYTVVFFGSGADKYRDLIQDSNAIFIKNIYPTTKSIIPIAEIYFKEKEFADIIYFEPFYMEEFQPTSS